MQNPTRIATVKATGRRYIVIRLDIPRAPGQEGKVHCWGEVISFRGSQRKHGPRLSFAARDVVVSEVEGGAPLSAELFQQNVGGLRAAGHVVERRGSRYVDRGTVEQVEATHAARRALMAGLASASATLIDPTLGRPAVRDGGHRALPEDRDDVLAGILERLTADGAPGAVRQEYSNGEFVTSSLIVGTSLAAVSDPALDLEAATNTAYFDPGHGVWWRHGGSFD